MEIVVIIGIIIFIIWLFSGSSSKNTRSYSNRTTYIDTYKPTTISSTPLSTNISVIPKKIESNPDLKISLVDGEYRYFQNHYINGIQYTFGFPKYNCPDKRVWVGKGSLEVERISYYEAKRRIKNQNLLAYTSKRLGSPNFSRKSSSDSESKVGYCSNCNKKLRGNIYKKYCTECYHKGYS